MKFKGQKQSVALSKLIKANLKPVTLAMTPEAAAERDTLLVKSNAVVKPTDAASQQLACDVAVELQERIKAVGKMRKELTKPLDDTISAAIAIERQYCAPLTAEIERIKRVVGEFQDEEDRRVEAAEEARLAELRRLDEEKKAAETKLEQATPRQAVKLEAEIERKDTQFNVLIRSESPQVVKATGQARVSKVKWVITDPKLAYEKNPHFFNPPEPRASVINQCAIPAEGRTEANPETALYPGLACWYEKTIMFRS